DSKECYKKRDKIKVRDSYSNPPVCGNTHGKEGEGSHTSQLDEKIIGVEAGLLTLNKRLVVVENNFSSLELVALGGLDEVKSNLIELEEVDETVVAGVVGPVNIRETRIETPRPKEFRGERNVEDIKNFLWQMNAYFKHSFNLRKNYEGRKKGVSHREGCYLCGETTHAARYCPSLSKLSAIVAAQKQQEEAEMQIGRSSKE
ncbi:hypothetical protein H5410_005765, partial [Solanum commersonii]